MIRINQIKISAYTPVDNIDNVICKRVVKKLNVTSDRIENISIYRKSLDARKKDDISFVYTVDVRIKNENKLRVKDKDITFITDKPYKFEYKNTNPEVNRPIIIGLGPAGLFCAYMLAKAGFKPIIFERGKTVEERQKDVEEFWNNGKLIKDSNVQFGEGGAGTFSDGKLNTLVKDKFGRNREVLKILTMFGAPSNIMYDSKPHIGTDVLSNVVANMRNEILALGATINYDTKVEDFIVEDSCVKGIIANEIRYYSDNIVLAIGHSARDTFECLYKRGIPMTPKAFAIGLRVMHPQNIININQYGADNQGKGLPTADYKLTYTASNGRGVYSFCMCPGGFVVNASSEENRLVVNGMSYHDRDSADANSAIVVQVTPEDYDGEDSLSGLRFQRHIEEKAFKAASGLIPLQRYGDFRHIVKPELSSEGDIFVEPLCKGGYSFGDLTEIMPNAVNKAFVEGMERFGHIIDGFNDGNVLLAGVESRTSSPVRIERNNTGESIFCGLYPCGEGAGYAGGITSAAMDGIFIAECVASSICNKGADE